MTQLEIHSGVLSGTVANPRPYPQWPLFRADPAANPREALEGAIRPHLESRQCAVQFSGGRDSSLVLAVAVHVARRNGLPLPVAVTSRYPGVPEAKEDDWQALVTQHLGVALCIVTVPPGEDELVAPFAVDLLRRYGPMFPPPAAVSLARMAAAVPGHVLLSGEGGDNVLGAEQITRWRGHLRTRRFPSANAWRLLVEELAPAAARRALIRRRLAQTSLCDWLRPAARAAVFDGLAREGSSASMDWRRGTWDFLNHRMFTGYRNIDEVARQEGISAVHPLTDLRFVEALCRRAGPFGYSDRTTVMRMLAADLLPDCVLARTTKSRFNQIYAGSAVRRFARDWGGHGVDPELVDLDALRSTWTADTIPAPALVPLQHAVRAALNQGWRPTTR